MVPAIMIIRAIIIPGRRRTVVIIIVTVAVAVRIKVISVTATAAAKIVIICIARGGRARMEIRGRKSAIFGRFPTRREAAVRVGRKPGVFVLVGAGCSSFLFDAIGILEEKNNFLRTVADVNALIFPLFVNQFVVLQSFYFVNVVASI
eukprot:Lithocolla_globosa_v1_NODE_1652_length_2417_cov_35.469094.p3 type:complete len:148 gc:universal NODE_1652_length_2417_cov_35.469094:835-392(-)